MTEAAAAASDAHSHSTPQEEKAFGFWLYLMSDAIIFALLFATYVVMAGNVADAPPPHSQFDLTHVFAETMILLASSITFGFATVAIGTGRRPAVQLWLLVTFALGLGFVLMELTEFRSMIAAGAGPDQSGALSAFFTLVGTHGLHVSIGLVWILVMMAQVALKGLSVPVVSRLERLGLFWHFLDIIWIGIFSVVYLPGLIE